MSKGKVLVLLASVILITALAALAVLQTPSDRNYSALPWLQGRTPVEQLDIPTQYGGGQREVYIFEGDYKDVLANAREHLKGASFQETGMGNSVVFLGPGVMIQVAEGRAETFKDREGSGASISRAFYESVLVTPQKGMVSVTVIEKDRNALKKALGDYEKSKSGIGL